MRAIYDDNLMMGSVLQKPRQKAHGFNRGMNAHEVMLREARTDNEHLAPHNRIKIGYRVMIGL